MKFEVVYLFEGNSAPLAGLSPEQWTRQNLSVLQKHNGGASFSVRLTHAAPLLDAELVYELAREMLRRGIGILDLPVGSLSLEGAERGTPKHRFDSLYCSPVTPETRSQICSELFVRIAEAHSSKGVFIPSATTVFIDRTVQIASGAEIMPFCVISGNSVIRKNARIGSGCNITDSVVGENSTVTASVLLGSYVGENCMVGPFAYLRQGTRLGQNVRIGDFVETKQAYLADGVKAAHHAYIGDAEVGANTNIGCGTVFANYNGKTKQKTVIGEGVFVGCNTNLIAPLKVGDNAFIAGGSTITEDIPQDGFAIARERQITKQKPKT